MFKLSKKIEYGLLALEYMLFNAKNSTATVREISDHYKVSQTLLAKILQALAKKKIIYSVQGAQGGYVFNNNAESISLMQIMEAIEGPMHITNCNTELDNCDRSLTCTLKNKMVPIEKGIMQHLNNITLADFIKE